MSDFKPIVLVPHTEFRVDSKKNYVEYNVYNEIRKALDEKNLSGFYGEYIFAFSKIKESKRKKERQEKDGTGTPTRMLEASKTLWYKLKASSLGFTSKEFTKLTALLYENFEITQDKLWRAPFGFQSPVILENKDIFLRGISRGAYAASHFKNEFSIKKMPDKKGDMKRPSQRSIAHVLGFMPVAILDIDDGLTISEAEEKLDKTGIAYAIVTTKSHGIKEGDRFRVFIPLELDSKDPMFKLTGMQLHKDDDNVRAFQAKEIAFLQYEIAKWVGLYDYVDKAPLGDLARKYMPSPPPEAPNHISIVKLDRTRLDLKEIAKSAAIAREEFEKEAALKKAEYAKKYGGETGIAEIMEAHPEWRIVFDRDLVSLTNPLEVIYKYEVDSGADASVINAWSENPRVKVSGHEYAIRQIPGGDGYIIKDFVSDKSTNLLGYLKEKFSHMEEFDRFVKLKKDFPHLFESAKLIHENPYFYLTKLTGILKEDGVCSEADIIRRLNEDKVAETIDMTPFSLIIKKKNDFTLKFIIDGSGLPGRINKASPCLAECLSSVSLYMGKKKAANLPDARQGARP